MKAKLCIMGARRRSVRNQPLDLEQVKDYNQIGGRYIEINIRAYGFDLALLNTYSHHTTRSYAEKEAHYNNLSAIITSIYS